MMDSLSVTVTVTVVSLVGMTLWNVHVRGATDRIREDALQALRESEARKAAILTSAFDAILSLDHHGSIVEFNPAAERMLGYQSGDVKGRRIEDVLLPSWLRDADRQRLSQCLETGQGPMLGQLLEMQVLRADGSELLVELVITRIENQRPPLFSAFLRDIAERKRLTEQFRFAIEASPAGMITVDGRGSITLVNSAAERLFGYPRAELIGRPLETLIPERFRSAHPGFRQLFFDDPVTRKMGSDCDLFGLRKDGGEVPIEIGLSPISTPEGMFTLASIVDITERKQAEADRVLRAELAERQRTDTLRSRLAAIVDSSDDAIISESLDGIIQTWNPGAERLFGYRADEIIGQPVVCLLPLDKKEDEAEILRRLRQGEHLSHMETIRRTRDGTSVPVSLTVSPIRNTEGQVVGASKFVQDITGRKAEEARREKLLVALEEKHAEMERFTYAVSHDLKSPLITIRSFVDIVRRDTANGRLDRVAGDLQRISNAADRMIGMLDELLKLSRMGRVVNPWQQVPMGDLILEAADLVAGQIHARGVTVSVDPDLPTVRCDRTRLLEVFQNLLDNAVKFMGDQPHPHVHVGAEASNGDTRFFVRDNGIGIPLRHQERVFGLFDKLDPSTAGSGVGLALVKRIIESHGGRIGVVSAEPSQGTTFWFTLGTPEPAAP